MRKGEYSEEGLQAGEELVRSWSGMKSGSGRQDGSRDVALEELDEEREGEAVEGSMGRVEVECTSEVESLGMESEQRRGLVDGPSVVRKGEAGDEGGMGCPS